MSKILSLVGQRVVAVSRLPTRQNLILQIESSNFSCLLAQKDYPIQSNTLASIPYCRNIFSAAYLRLDSLEVHQKNITQFYQTDKNSYIERIKRYIERDDPNSILLQDLVNVIGLADDEEDLDLIESIAQIMKMNNQFSIKNWSSAVMRLYFKMNQMDRALNNIKDEHLYGDFFNNFTCYRLAMVMFYNNERYDEVLEIYNLAVKRLQLTDPSSESQGRLLNIATVALAAAARQNKQESFDVAEKIFASLDLNTANQYMKTRVVSFMAYIAYISDQPSVALNIVSNSRSQNYITLRELKTLSLLKLERYEDVIFHLRANLMNVTGREVKNSIPRDVFSEVREKALGLANTVGSNLLETLDEIEKSGFVTDESLISIIFSEINPPKGYQENKRKRSNNY